MAIKNYYRDTVPSYLTLFVETSPGLFTTEVSTNTTTNVSSSGTAQVAVAVPIVTARYCTGWTNGGTVTAYGISTRTGSSSAVAYPTAGSGNGVSVTITDAHGTHSGTVTGSYKANCVVGVRHLTTASGYTFKGWKVTRGGTAAAYGSVLSTGGTASGAVTTFGEDYTGAVVVHLGSQAVTIEAVYEVAQSTYTVTFDKVSSDVTGADIPDISVAAGGSVILPAAELWTRDGYVFGGWSATSGGSAQYQAGDSYTPSGDVTLYAVWTSTGGDGAKADTSSTRGTLTITTYKDKYRFSVSSNVKTGAFTLSYDTRLLGSRLSKHYVYSPNNNPNPTVTTTSSRGQGSDSTRTATVPTGSSVSTDTPSGVTLYVPGDYLTYYYYYRSNDGSAYYTADSTTGATNVDSDWVWTAPEIANYEFVGWYTLAQSWAAAHTPTNAEYTTLVSGLRSVPFSTILSRVNSVLTQDGLTTTAEWKYYTNFIQAKYQGIQVLVLFDATGAELDDFYRLVRYGAAYGSLPTPTRAGYTFDGWFTAASGGTEVTASTDVSTGSQHTLYAHWTASASTHVLYFSATGGTCSEATRTVTCGTAYGSLPTPTRTGYTFLGWFTLPSGGTEVTAATVACDDDAVIYAHWRGAAVTVTFDATGGTCSEATRTVYAGAAIGALPTPTKSGYNFGGWFAAGGSQVLASTIVSAAITLSARWSQSSTPRVIVRYKIKFTLNGGTLSSAYECKYTRGVAKSLPTAAQITRTGYTFAGWYATADFTGDPATVIPASSTGTRSFFAKWTA